MHYAITYVSSKNNSLDKAELEKLLESSKKNNNRNGVTGILLYSEGNFFQIIEGKKETIVDLYQKIETDKRHHNIIKIVEKEIHKEAYDGYESDFIAENEHVSKEKFQNYLDYLRVLGKPTQVAVENMLKALIVI